MATFSQWEDLRRRPRGSEPWQAVTAGPRRTGAHELRADAGSHDAELGAADPRRTAG